MIAARPDPLGVWMDGILVAEMSARKPRDIRCRYTADALARWERGIPLMSCSLPLGAGRPNASAFAAGLLPEGRHRLAMAANAGVASHDTFGLLARYGRDVAGALVIGRESPAERPGGVEAYTPSQLDDEVAGLPERPLALHDDSELSLAGLQDKLLLVRLADGGWGRPVHGAPSTHILKRDDGRYPGLIEAEAACLHLARAVGLTTVECELADIGGARCLIVSRYDRRTISGGGVERLHQEDACQALGRDPEAALGRGKYESAGGPTLVEIADILDRWSSDPAAEVRRLLAVATFQVAIGNADAHGKNVSLLHPTPGVVALAPLYDTVPTALWPNLRSAAAMAVNGVSAMERITIDDLVAEGSRWGLPASTGRGVVADTLGRIRGAVDTTCLATGVTDMVKRRLDRFAAAERPQSAGGGAQGRVPRGVPSGGHFTGAFHPESGISLSEPGA